MPERSEKEHADEILRATREDERRKIREAFPVPAATLKSLFDFVTRRLRDSECDNTLCHAREFIRSHRLPEQAIVTWLEDNHGYCDCEAIMNSEEIVQDAVPGYGEMEPSA